MVRVAVIGAGQMGVKIAGDLAFHGNRVKIYDSNTKQLNKVRTILNDDKQELMDDGLLPQRDFMGSVFCMSQLDEAVREADWIIEAIVERTDIKQDIFEKVSACCKENAIITTNTLNLDVNRLCANLPNKEKFLGLRFLFPVYHIPEVEVTPAKYTDGDVIEKVRTMLENMGKTLFFRSGSQPLILTEDQRIERKKARLNEMLSQNAVSVDRLVPKLKHEGSTRIRQEQHDALTQAEEHDCCICMDEARDCLLRPCHHLVTCHACGDMLAGRGDACPVCRVDIESIIKVYHN